MKLWKKGFMIDKKQLRVGFIILLLGVFLGFLFYIKLDSTTILEQIKNIDTYLQGTHINFIWLHILVLFFLFSVSFSFVFLFFFAIYFIWEIACASYACSIFIDVFGFMGLFFGIFYNIVIKFVFLILLLVIFKKLYFLLKNRNHSELGQIIRKTKLEIAFFFILILVYDVFLYFMGSEILLKLTFLVQ